MNHDRKTDPDAIVIRFLYHFAKPYNRSSARWLKSPLDLFRRCRGDVVSLRDISASPVVHYNRRPEPLLVEWLSALNFNNVTPRSNGPEFLAMSAYRVSGNWIGLMITETHYLRGRFDICRCSLDRGTLRCLSPASILCEELLRACGSLLLYVSPKT